MIGHQGLVVYNIKVMTIELTAYALLFTIAAIGISETAYLIRSRKKAEQPVCPIGGGCTTVLTSKYSKIFGVHNDLLGFGFYVGFAGVLALLVLGVGPANSLLLLARLMLAVATIMSIFFVYIQARVIKQWCFWCLMSAGTIALMDIIVLFAKTI